MSDTPVTGDGLPTPSISTEPSDTTLVEAPSQSAPLVAPSSTKQPVEHLLSFPPFPETPTGVQIIPFSQFNECGIQLFCDEDGDEVDGHGRPTVPLKRGHAADVRKTQGKKKKAKTGDAAEDDDANDADEDDEVVVGAAGLAQPTMKKKKRKGKNKKLMSEQEIEALDPVNKAKEKRKHQMAMFAKVEWYKQWAAGDDLRIGKKGYDPNSSPIDRMHIAATEFRLGRVWPRRSTQLHYLWEQFRLYAGLLGSPPVWIRTDRPPEDDDEDEVVEEPSEPVEEEAQATSTKVKKQYDDNLAHYSDESEEFEEEPEDLDGSNPDEANDVANDSKKPAKTKPKRVPPRTPYGLYNVEPLPLKSDDEVNLLLKVAGERRDARLHRFITDPEHSVRIFLSWYMRQEGFVFTPSFMVNFPHLVSFFLKFLLRSKVLPESERSLKRAIAVAETAIDEMPRIFNICKLLPDKVGLGCRGIWGQRWEEEWLSELKTPYATTTAGEEMTHAETLKEFEEQLKAENVQFLPANPDDLGPPSAGLTELAAAKPEDEEGPSNLGIITQTVTFEVVDQSITADSVPRDHEVTYNGEAQTASAAFIEEISDSAVAVPTVVEASTSPPDALPEVKLGGDAKPPTVTATAVSAEDVHLLKQASSEHFGPSDVEHFINGQVKTGDVMEPMAPTTTHGYESEEEANDWTMEGGPRKLTEEERATKRQQIYKAWGPSADQPLTELLGMSVFPMRFEAGGRGASRGVGVVERSIRKVHSVIPPGPVERGKWRGVEEDLATRLGRVVLTPWTDWNDGGVASEYLKPRIQQASIPSPTLTEGEEARSEPSGGNATGYSHDPLHDDITVLVDPEIAGLMRVGMAFAGTWVQLIPLREYSSSAAGRSRGRGRGRGRGARGAHGSGRGGALPAISDNKADNGGETPTTVTAGAPSQFDEGDQNFRPGTGPHHTRGRGRGRGRGHGGLSHHGADTDASNQKESTFWYIEEVYLGVPSYWNPGEEDPPIELADLALDDIDN